MEVGIGLPSTIPGAGRDQTAGMGQAGGGARVLDAGHDRPRRVSEPRAPDRPRRGGRGDRADPPRDHDPARAHPGQRRAARQAGGHARRAVGRAPRARRGRRPPRGRLSRLRRRLPRARADPRRDARPLGPDLGRRGVRHGRGDRPAAGPTAAPPSSSAAGRDAAFTRAARHGDGWTGGNCTLEELADGTARLRAAWEAAGRDGSPRTMVQPYYALGDGAEQAVDELPARLLRVRGGLHGRDRGAGRDRRRDGARERPGVRRGGMRRADLLPLRPGSGPGRPARGRTRGDRVRHVSEPARPGGVRQRRRDRARRRVRRPARGPGGAGRLRRRAGRRRERARRDAGPARPPRAALPALRRARRRRPCRTRSPSPASGSDR